MQNIYSRCAKCGAKSRGHWCAFCTENMRRKEKGLAPKLRGRALNQVRRQRRAAARKADGR
jgi:hypothetical protein